MDSDKIKMFSVCKMLFQMENNNALYDQKKLISSRNSVQNYVVVIKFKTMLFFTIIPVFSSANVSRTNTQKTRRQA